jgi:hypothetical protein
LTEFLTDLATDTDPGLGLGMGMVMDLVLFSLTACTTWALEVAWGQASEDITWAITAAASDITNTAEHDSPLFSNDPKSITF